MGMNFDRLMKIAVDSFEERMAHLHNEYMHLFHDNSEEDGHDIQEMVDRVLKSFDDICVTVQEVGERILERRKNPAPKAESNAGTNSGQDNVHPEG